MFKNYTNFLDDVFKDVSALGIDISAFELDHIAYTTTSSTEYNEMRPQILALGKLVAEDLVNGRRVGVVRLNKPLVYKDREIPAIELIEPVIGTAAKSRLDHIEFVLPMGFNQFMEDYPGIPWDTSSMKRPEYPHLKVKGLRVKFHELSIFNTIERQRRNRETL